MNDDKKGEEKKETVPPTVEKKEEDKKESPSQSNVRKELDKVKKPTQKQKLLYTKERIEKQLAELGDDDGTIEPTPSEDDDDSKPLTVGDLKRLQKKEAQNTALTMADDIKDEDDRELTKHYLQTRIVLSGNPVEDLRLAQALVNSVKNEQIAEIAKTKRQAKTQSSGSGAPAKSEDTFEPTQEELQMAAFAGKKDEKSIKEFVLKGRKNQERAGV